VSIVLARSLPVRAGSEAARRGPAGEVGHFLDELLSQHLQGTVIKPCPCHGFRYVFRGHRATKRAEQPVGPRLAGLPSRASGRCARSALVAQRLRDVAFQPAAMGSYPQKAPRPAQPVPVLTDLWPRRPA
jgi:hypothetical protein